MKNYWHIRQRLKCTSNMINMQQEQNSPTLLEVLPNEIFIQILPYLNGVDAFIAFSSLNNRFQSLVFQHCKLFNFKSICHSKFDLIFQQHDTQQWISLCLFNDETTHEQIEYFIRKYSSNKCFHGLESLSILSTTSINEDILSRLLVPENLVSLTIGFVCETKMPVLNLPKLKKLCFTSCTNTDWIKNSPQLENIEYTLIDHTYSAPISTWPCRLKRLKIVFSEDIHIQLVQESLRYSSQLTTLEIYQKKMGNSPPDGQIWEKLICTLFPSLKNFKFYFQFICSSFSSNQVVRIFALFSTRFYLIEKNWIVRCDIQQSNAYKRHAVLYSLPFAFDQFTVVTHCFNKSISMLPFLDNNNLNRNIYANVKTLIFEKNLMPTEDFNRTNITHLVLNNYIEVFKWVHVLTKLCHLEIGCNVRIGSKCFTHLLESIPSLYSLTVEKDILQEMTENWSSAVICNQLSKKIRCLKLRFKCSQTNTDELHRIVRIFSGCEHLSISCTISIEAIAFIFVNMYQLRSLSIDRMSSRSISRLWIELERYQKMFNRSNSSIIDDVDGHYFWSRKYSDTIRYI